MAVTLNFRDRFSYPAPQGIDSSTTEEQAENLTEDQIITRLPLFKMVEIVRRASVLLRRRTALEIFKIITNEADPRIALILAAAKRKDNTFLFQGLGHVREVMFADPDRPNSSGQLNQTLFSDGIRRVSASLTASILIGQLAQVPEQAEHAKVLEDQALKDLDRICTTYEMSVSQSTSSEPEETFDSGFIFNSGSINLSSTQTLECSWYASHLLNTWIISRNYNAGTTVTAAQIVSDFSDSINSISVRYENEGLVAAPQLSGFANQFYSQVHLLSFYPRANMPSVLAYSLNLKIDLKNNNISTNTSPFKWGTHINSLTTNSVNGLVILLRNNKTSTINTTDDNVGQPVVLYIRNKAKWVIGGATPPATSKIKIRVQFWSPTEVDPTTDFTEIEFNRIISNAKQLELDNSRHSQAAAVILKEITITRNYSGISAAIIKNDPTDFAIPEASIELLAWTLSRLNTYVILDILEMPEDLEIATGDLMGAQSSYSNNPKSIRVSAKTISGGAFLNNSSYTQPPLISSTPRRSPIIQNIEDQVNQLNNPSIWPSRFP